MPCKDDKPEDTEISPFEAGSDYLLSARRKDEFIGTTKRFKKLWRKSDF